MVFDYRELTFFSIAAEGQVMVNQQVSVLTIDTAELAC